MDQKQGDDAMIVKVAAVSATIVGLVTVGLLLFGGASKEQISQLSTAFHEFAVSVDARLRVVENDQYQQREQILNEHSSYNDLKNRIDQIEQASRASLAPNRHAN